MRKRKYPARPEDLPLWMRDLRGFDHVTSRWRDSGGGDPDAPWRIEMIGPSDPEATKVDPIIGLVALAFDVARIEERKVQLVRLCREEGKSWTQIGEALGISKQSAWERYSGED